MTQFGELKYAYYQVLILDVDGWHWKTIDTARPLFEQTRLMYGYRLLDKCGHTVKQSRYKLP